MSSHSQIDPSKGVEQSDVMEYAEFYDRTIGRIVSNLFTKIDSFPMELRSVLKYSSDIAHEKFPGKEIICVGAIFFLRYFNPAIIAPVENGILTDPPMTNMVRTGILLTKILQNVANNVKISPSTKESYMLSVAGTIEENIKRGDTFMNDLINNVKETERSETVSESMYLLALQHFQKEFKNIIDFKQENPKYALFQTILQAIISNVKDYTLDKGQDKNLVKDGQPVVIHVKHRAKPSTTYETNVLQFPNDATLILRPLVISNHENRDPDASLDMMRSTLVNLSKFIMDTADAMKYGDDPDTIADENRRGNHVIGQYIRNRFIPALLCVLNDGIVAEDGHAWHLVKKIRMKNEVKHEQQQKLIVSIDREVKGETNTRQNDLKFHYFVSECINERSLLKNLGVIIQSRAIYYKKDVAFIFSEKVDLLLIRYMRTIDKFPYKITLHAHKELRVQSLRIRANSQILPQNQPEINDALDELDGILNGL